MSKRALLIATETALSSSESGASLRLEGVRQCLVKVGFEVTTVTRSDSKLALENYWDLIVLVSFATSRLIRKARKSSRFLWFDATDSWTLSRWSLFRNGEFKQIIILIGELFWIWTAPKLDLITFISVRDSERERRWWKYRTKPIVFANYGLDRKVSESHSSRIVFVGDGDYGPNKRAKKFLRQIATFLPPDFQIHVFGRGAEEREHGLLGHGFVNQNSLYYSKDIHIAPITSGAGIKMKVAIPLWNGLRVVATREASNGFTQNANLCIASSPEEFAMRIIDMNERPFQEPIGKPRNDIYATCQISDVIEWLSQCSRSLKRLS